MAIELSIKIPSNDDLVGKNFYFLYSNQQDTADDSLWASAIYEVWNSLDVYEDLCESIKQYVVEVDCALQYKDFSEKTTKELDLTKDILLEGVQFCGHHKNGLLKPLQDMFDILERYVAAKKEAKEKEEKKEKEKIKRIMENVETLSNRIIQFQVDIQVAIMELSEGSFSQEYFNFLQERVAIKKEMKLVKKNGANKKEIERLEKLLKSLKMDFKQFKKLWVNWFLEDD